MSTRARRGVHQCTHNSITDPNTGDTTYRCPRKARQGFKLCPRHLWSSGQMVRIHKLLEIKRARRANA